MAITRTDNTFDEVTPAERHVLKHATWGFWAVIAFMVVLSIGNMQSFENQIMQRWREPEIRLQRQIDEIKIELKGLIAALDGRLVVLERQPQPKPERRKWVKPRWGR